MTAESPEAAIISRLCDTGKKLAAAESCTGGLIAHRLTNVPGASAVFMGGAIAYSNEIKASLLGVPLVTLETHGAVSEAVAKKMAEGALACFASDVAVAVTGIAGPGGGTAEKPVGLVFIGLAQRGAAANVTRRQFAGTREQIKEQTAATALALLEEYLS